MLVLFDGKSKFRIPMYASTSKESIKSDFSTVDQLKSMLWILLLNMLNYNDLISSYTKFNTLYHDRGDIRSANKSYVEVKTIETRRQKYLLKTNWDFNVYINYQLNVFLSFFSDYATNPGKSLIQSLWVLLIFTFFYMFSFSGWDGMNYPFYLKQFNDFAKYIKHDKPIGEIYPSKENPHKKQLEKLHDKYLYAGKKVPKVLLLFGIPLYFLENSALI